MLRFSGVHEVSSTLAAAYMLFSSASKLNVASVDVEITLLFVCLAAEGL
jgi:hypothetical protein